MIGYLTAGGRHLSAADGIYGDADTSGGTAPETTYTYDADGNLHTQTAPKGNVSGAAAGSYTTTYGYDAINELASVTDALGDETQYGYDDAGNKTSVTDPRNNQTQYQFNLNHKVTQVTDAAGHTTKAKYDLDGLLTQQTDANGNTTLLTLDADGQVTQQEVPAQKPGAPVTYDTTQYKYDQAGHQTEVISPRGVAAATAGGSTADYNYDPFGRLDTVTSGGQTIQSNSYDGFDNLTATSQLNAQSGSMDTTSYSYDSLNRRASQTTGAGTTSFSYLGTSSEVASESDPGGVSKTYDYTPAGARLSQDTTGGTGATGYGYYTYNGHSDVEALTGANGDTTATYGYTAYGNPVPSMFTGVDKNDATPSSSSTTQPYSAYRFNAMRWDSTSGSYDMGFRNYDPGLNQFDSRDMYNGATADMGLTADPFTGSPYAFGDGNPISNIESDGHMACAGPGTSDCSVQGGPQMAASMSKPSASTSKSSYNCISTHVCVGNSDPNGSALQQAWNQLLGEYGKPTNEYQRWEQVCQFYSALCHKEGIAAQFSLTLQGEATTTQDAWQQGFAEILGGSAGVTAAILPGTSAASDLRTAAARAIQDFESTAMQRLGTGTHGNSLDNPAETYLYRLETEFVDYLKTGITSEPKPADRLLRNSFRGRLCVF